MAVTIVSRIFAPEPGAAPLRLRALAEALVRAGERVRVVTAAPTRDTVETYEAPGMDVSRAWVKRNREGYVRGYVSYMSFDLPAVFRLLLGRVGDGIVVEPPPTTAAVVRVVSALRRRRYVYYAADVWSDAADTLVAGFVSRTLRAVEKWGMNGAALVLSVSPQVADRVRELGVTSPIEVTGFGIDAATFRPLGAPAGDGPAVFVYPGTYSERHGAEVFAAALGRVLEVRPGSARLEFYGTGTDAELIMAACPPEHRDAISFNPPVGAESIARIMSHADAGLASVKPGQGYDYAFATKTLALMATGCPVVYTGPGPAADVVREASAVHGACRAVAFDVDQVADAMLAIVDHRATAGERDSLAAWTGERHSALAVADRAARLVKEALAR